MDSLIKTRVIAPKLAGNIIHRDRLLKVLSENAQKKLILVCGAAGSGKTTLVQDFLSQNSKKFAWLHIHPDSDNFYSFISYILESLKEIKKDFGINTGQIIERARQTFQITKSLKTVINDVIGTFLNELCRTFTEEIFIVIDDLSNISSSEWLNLTFDKLFEELPPNVHIIITARQFPDFNINFLFAKRQILKLEYYDLIFNISETSELLENIYSLQCTEEEVKILDKNVNGWVTGIHLILQTYGKNLTKLKFESEKVPEDIFTFFAGDIFKNLDETIRDFLLETALLESFTAELCDILFKRKNSGKIIQELLNKNIFIQTSLVFENGNSSGAIYSYQILFKKFLTSKLFELRTEKEVQALLLKVYKYFLDSGNYINAVNYALKAKQYVLAIPLLIKQFQLMVDSGKLEILWKWIEILPSEIADNNPNLLYFKARLIQFYKGDIEGSMPFAESAIKMFEKEKFNDNLIRCYIFKARNLVNLGMIKEAISFLKKFINTKINASDKAKVMYYLAFAYYQNAQYDEALKLLDLSINACIENKIKDIQISVYNLYGHIYLIRGDYSKSAIFYERAATISDSKIQNFETYCNLVLLYSQTGKFEQAMSCLEIAQSIAEQIPIMFIENAYLLASQGLWFEFGDYEEAINLLNKMNSLAVRLNHKYYKYLSYSLLGDTYYYLNMLTKAEEYYELAFSFIDDDNKMETIVFSSMKAIHHKKTEINADIESVLQEALEFYNRNSLMYNKMQILYHLADYYYKSGEYMTSLHYLTECLKIASEKEYISFLQREVMDSKTMFDFALANNIKKDFVKSLISSVIEKSEAEWLSDAGRKRIEKETGNLNDITVNTFGRLEFIVRGKNVPESFWQKKKWKLIFLYLFLSPGYAVSKDKIIDIFYPDTGTESADNIFHQIISRFRSLLKIENETEIKKQVSIKNKNTAGQKKAQNIHLMPSLIVYESKVISLNRDLKYKSDKEEFEKNYMLAKHSKKPNEKIRFAQNAADLYKGYFLDGIYETWSEDLRNSMHENFISLCEELVKLHYSQRNYNECVLYSDKLLQFDKLNETAYEFSIKAYKNAGKNASAGEKYSQMLKSYEREINEKPPLDFLEKLKLLLS